MSTQRSCETDCRGWLKRINALGMKFGLWLEPEMISEDSDLYRSHPDWGAADPGKKTGQRAQPARAGYGA